MNEDQKDRLDNAPSPQPAGPDLAEDDLSQTLSARPEEDDDDGISLPLSAREDDDYVSLPLSAYQEEGGYSRQAAEQSYTPPPLPEPEWKEPPPGDNFSVRALTEGAMLIAIALLLAFVGNYVPVLNTLGQLLFPLPIAVLVFRRGLKVGAVASTALFGLSFTFLPPAQALLMIIQYGLLGLFLGYCFRKGKSPLFTLGFATMIAAFGTLVSLLLSVFISGLPMDAILTEADEMVTEMLTMMQANGSLDASLAARGITFEQFRTEALAFAKKLLPAALILSAMGMTLICYLVSAKVLRRLRYRIPQLPSFAYWRMDWRLTWGLIAGLFLGWISRLTGIGWMENLGDNITYVFGAVIFVCGLSLLLWLLKNKNLNMVIKIVIVVVVLQFFAIAMYLVVLLAVFDALRDLRPWFQRKIESSPRWRKKDL